MRCWIVFFFFIFGMPLAHSQEEIRRSMFIWSLEDQPVLCSKEKIQQAISFAHEHGIQTLFVQVYRANKAWFPSRVADSELYRDCLKKVGDDSFGFLIKEAHAQGIEVHAWMNMLSLSANKEAKILKKYGPGILTRNLTLK